MNRVQFILSFYLLLRLLSCKSLLSSDCLHCLKTSTNLSNSITLSNILYGSTSVTFRNFFEYLYYNLRLIDLQFIKKIIEKYQNIKTKKLTKEVDKVTQIFI